MDVYAKRAADFKETFHGSAMRINDYSITYTFGVSSYRLTCVYAPAVCLPLLPEVRSLIQAYLTVSCSFRVTIPVLYPFFPAEWAPADSSQLTRCLSEIHNEAYLNDYSPATTIHADCVYMLTRLVRFNAYSD